MGQSSRGCPYWPSLSLISVRNSRNSFRRVRLRDIKDLRIKRRTGVARWAFVLRVRTTVPAELVTVTGKMLHISQHLNSLRTTKESRLTDAQPPRISPHPRAAPAPF